MIKTVRFAKGKTPREAGGMRTLCASIHARRPCLFSRSTGGMNRAIHFTGRA